MLVEVRLLRYQGKRIPQRDFENGPKYQGQLRTAGAKGTDRPIVAQLHKADGLFKPLLPALFDPVFSGVNFQSFFIRGIERVEYSDGIYGVVQEWECRPILSCDLEYK